jgi:hypothetical protein
MKKLTMPAPSQENVLKSKNECVKTAYFAILSEIKSLITIYPSEYLRTFIEVDYSGIGFSNQHGFYSPLLHLRFEENKGECTIYFARNYNLKDKIGYYLDNLLTRCVYAKTAKGNYEIDIEDTLNVSYYRIDDYREAKNLLDSEFKGCKKVTVEFAKKEAA